MEFASKGVGSAALATGIIGTSLGALNSGLLGNLFGGGRNEPAKEAPRSETTTIIPMMGGSSFMGGYIDRYEMGLQNQIMSLTTEVKLRDANSFTLGEMDKLRNYVDSRFAVVERELADQRVYNATNIATVNCLSGQVAQLLALTKMVVPITSICPQPAVATTT